MSQGLAPWDNLSYKIWTCGLDAGQWPRCDVHFEIHNLDVAKRGRNKAYLQFLAGHPNVVCAKKDQRIPHGQVFPVAAAIERFGNFAFKASFSYMMAKAILDIEYQEMQKEAEIVLFGCDLTHPTECNTNQRVALQYFIHEAKRAGIRCSAPMESDIMQAPPMYGLEQFDPFFVKKQARLVYISEQHAKVNAEMQQLAFKEAVFRGTLEELNYDISTWGTLDYAQIGSGGED